jgi:signal recognition particle receptor subunit beta
VCSYAIATSSVEPSESQIKDNGIPMTYKNHKILITGPVGAGKTTAIQAVSDIQVVNTDVAASDATKNRKPQTTVAMDYGLVKLGEQQKIHLYGTPGQQRFNFMWEVLSEGALGLILLLDNSRDDPQQDLAFFTQTFKDFIGKRAMAVGVTRFDEQATPTLDDYRDWMNGYSISVPIFGIDARERQDILSLLQVLVPSLDNSEAKNTAVA